MSESDNQREIVKYLDMIGAKVFETHDARHRPCHVGIPDLIGCYRGLFFAIEVKKSNSEKPSPDQNKELAGIQKANGKSCVAYCVEQVIEFMAVSFGVQSGGRK